MAKTLTRFRGTSGHMLYADRNGKSAGVRQSSMVAQKTPIAAEIAERARRAIAKASSAGARQLPPARQPRNCGGRGGGARGAAGGRRPAARWAAHRNRIAMCEVDLSPASTTTESGRQWKWVRLPDPLSKGLGTRLLLYKASVEASKIRGGNWNA